MSVKTMAPAAALAWMPAWKRLQSTGGHDPEALAREAFAAGWEAAQKEAAWERQRDQMAARSALTRACARWAQVAEDLEQQQAAEKTAWATAARDLRRLATVAGLGAAALAAADAPATAWAVWALGASAGAAWLGAAFGRWRRLVCAPLRSRQHAVAAMRDLNAALYALCKDGQRRKEAA